MIRRWIRRFLSHLRIRIDFPDRQYTLGDSIDLTVEVIAKRDIQIREWKIELVCEEEFAETYVRKIGLRAPAGIITRGKGHTIEMVPKREVVVKKEQIVHTTSGALKGMRLSPPRAQIFKERLIIDEMPPPHAAAEGTMRWSVRVTFQSTDDRIEGVSKKVEVKVM